MLKVCYYIIVLPENVSPLTAVISQAVEHDHSHFFWYTPRILQDVETATVCDSVVGGGASCRLHTIQISWNGSNQAEEVFHLSWVDRPALSGKNKTLTCSPTRHHESLCRPKSKT